MIVGLVDALRGLLPLPADVVADDTATEPFRWLPNRLYAFPRRAGPQQLELEAEEMGFFASADLRVTVVLCLPARGEPRAPVAARELSEALDDGTVAILDALWASRVYPPGSGALWHHLVVEGVRPDAVRQLEARGHAVDVRLLLSPQARAALAGGAS